MIVLVEQSAHTAIRFHRFDLIPEKLDSVESKPGGIADCRFNVLRIDHRIDSRSRTLQ